MQTPTHYCTICLSKWRKHGDETWSLCDEKAGNCCDNAPMGSQIKPLPDVENIEDHMAISCEKCGSVNFALLKSGKVECNKCGQHKPWQWRYAMRFE